MHLHLSFADHGIDVVRCMHVYRYHYWCAFVAYRCGVFESLCEVGHNGTPRCTPPQTHSHTLTAPRPFLIPDVLPLLQVWRLNYGLAVQGRECWVRDYDGSTRGDVVTDALHAEMGANLWKDQVQTFKRYGDEMTIAPVDEDKE